MTFRRCRLATLVLVGLLIGAVSGQATVHNISVGNFFFSPANTVVNYGDTVRWTFVSGIHSSTSDGSSAKTWDSGILGAGTDTFELGQVQFVDDIVSPLHLIVTAVKA